ncbi:MAG: nucleotide exchange factor GrpE [Clostridia bacterium]|nr:nucleotide exchange factor GrpE [Clostridia bacterium]
MKKKFPIGKKRKDRKTVNEKPDENIMENAEGVPEESSAENAAPEEGEKAGEAQNSAGDEKKLFADRLEKAEKARDEYLDMAQRIQAEFDNYRRRNASLRAESFEDGAREVIKLLLPVVDNLERALEAPSADEKLKEGVAMTLKQMLGILEKRGVTAIDRKGEKFDPRLENAVMQVDASQGEPGTVAAVLQKGYRMGDFVLRHAMVQVVAE